MELALGSTVVCRDGKAGRLGYIVVDPSSKQIMSLIVISGRLRKRSRVVPVTWITASTSEQIVLDATCADLDRLPEYREVTCVCPDLTDRPLYGHPGASAQAWLGPYLEVSGCRRCFVEQVRLGVDTDRAVLIGQNLPVHARGGQRIGCVRQWMINNQQRITHLVIRRGRLIRYDQTVTLAQVERIDEDGVLLKLDANALKQKPPRKPTSNRALPRLAPHNRS